MFYVYVLKNKKQKIYVGFSADLRERLREHNRGGVRYTKSGRPWKLVYYEAFLAKIDAHQREQTLKNYGSTLGQLKKRISGSLYC